MPAIRCGRYHFVKLHAELKRKQILTQVTCTIVDHCFTTFFEIQLHRQHYTFILVLPNQDHEYVDTDQIRSGSNDVFNDLVNVCCAEEDLVPDELNKPNWALTKDPTMCKDFENSGYRYAKDKHLIRLYKSNKMKNNVM